MCGIAGFVLPVEATAGREHHALLHDMCALIAHRGPDDDGFHVAGRVGLGMRRLAIIDVAGGHQPLFNEDGRVAVVLNGEIYNHGALRAHLESRGHVFRTRSDTEVIVHGYEEYGADVVSHLRGMFAFAVWDARHATLVLARDRVGKKPLFYATLADGTLLFASELKCLAAHPQFQREVDPGALDAYLTFGYVPESYCILRGAAKVPPGCVVTFRESRLATRRYWEFPRSGTGSPPTDDELLSLLDEAVSVRLESEVPLGAFLSGGLDSSLIVALMAARLNRQVRTFSIGFAEDEFNELAYARRVAALFDTEHHEFVVTPDLCAIVDDLVWHLDEPFADSSAVPTYYVARLAREFVTVALSGDGGDEVFGGYTRYRVHREREGLSSVLQVFGPAIRPVVSAAPNRLPGRAFAYNLSLTGVERYIDSVSMFGRLARNSLYSGGLTTAVRGIERAGEQFRDLALASGDPRSIGSLLRLDSLTYLPGDILTKVDRMTMAASLEARAPLLDHVLIERIASTDASVRISNGTLKSWLKRVARRLLPEDIVDRRKAGFGVPLGAWMRLQLGSRVEDTICSSRALGRGYFEPRYLRHLLSEHRRQRRDHSAQLWALFMLELWHQQMADGVPRMPGRAAVEAEPQPQPQPHAC